MSFAVLPLQIAVRELRESLKTGHIRTDTFDELLEERRGKMSPHRPDHHEVALALERALPQLSTFQFHALSLVSQRTSTVGTYHAKKRLMCNKSVNNDMICEMFLRTQEGTYWATIRVCRSRDRCTAMATEGQKTDYEQGTTPKCSLKRGEIVRLDCPSGDPKHSEPKMLRVTQVWKFRNLATQRDEP